MKNQKFDMPIYLDNNSTTQMDERVFEFMKPYFIEKFGNASSKTHPYGWDAELAVDGARKEVASLIKCEPKEIFFTSGGTESNNIVLQGIVSNHKRSRPDQKVHIISTEIEHHAVLKVLRALEEQNVEVTYLKPDKYGRIDPMQVKNSIKPNTVLVSIIFANNEIGTINPISEIGQICQVNNIPFHSDAVQAIGQLPIDVQSLNLDSLSISAHKLHGPKGVGAFFLRQTPRQVKISPILFGGSQEREFRPGTLNIPGIVGLGKACSLVQNERSQYIERIESLRDQLTIEVLKIPFAKLNGHPIHRLPNNINITFEGISQTSIVMDLKKLALSTGSACSTGSPNPSHVLKAIGLSEEDCFSSIRLGISKFTTPADIQVAAEEFKRVIFNLKNR